MLAIVVNERYFLNDLYGQHVYFQAPAAHDCHPRATSARNLRSLKSHS